MTQPIQILHIDSLCNECGNCGTFCPFEGEPYRDKPTLFKDRSAMEASRNAGFAVVAKGDETRPSLLLRAEAGAGISELSCSEWAEAGPGALMVDLALTVLRDHRYLLGGAP